MHDLAVYWDKTKNSNSTSSTSPSMTTRGISTSPLCLQAVAPLKCPHNVICSQYSSTLSQTYVLFLERRGHLSVSAPVRPERITFQHWSPTLCPFHQTLTSNKMKPFFFLFSTGPGCLYVHLSSELCVIQGVIPHADGSRGISWVIAAIR